LAQCFDTPKQVTSGDKSNQEGVEWSREATKNDKKMAKSGHEKRHEEWSRKVAKSGHEKQRKQQEEWP
jgi:hypothetical protein